MKSNSKLDKSIEIVHQLLKCCLIYSVLSILFLVIAQQLLHSTIIDRIFFAVVLYFLFYVLFIFLWLMVIRLFLRELRKFF